MFRRRRRVEPFDFTEELARFNAERARGLVHTESWLARMAVEQQRFDERTRSRAGSDVSKLTCRDEEVGT